MLAVSHIVPKRTKDPCYARDVSITCSGMMNCVTEQVTSRVKEKQQHQMHFPVSLSGKNLVQRESQQECGENIDGKVEGKRLSPSPRCRP